MLPSRYFIRPSALFFSSNFNKFSTGFYYSPLIKQYKAKSTYPPDQFYANNGPANWAKHFPAAKGVRQSPIDFVPEGTKFDASLVGAKFEFHYNPVDCATLKNNGNTWMVTARPGSKSYVRTGVSQDEFKFLQMHMHWGSDACDGTEHTIDRDGFAGELHIVHYNAKYGDSVEASKHGDGFLVLGIFVEQGKHSTAFDPLARLMDRVMYKGDEIKLPNGYDFKLLLPTNTSQFWTYDGSLTTPPCTECVLWIVFRQTITISEQQLDEIRQLYTVTESESKRYAEKLIRNVRPVQSLNNRVIRCSFDD